MLATQHALAMYLRVEVEDADFARVDDGADRLDRRAVQVLLELSVLDELLRRDVRLEHDARHEVVVAPVHLLVLLGSTRV